MKKTKRFWHGLVPGMMAAVLAASAGAAAAQPLTGLYVCAASEDKDYTIGDAYWSEDDGRALAEWDKAESSTRYKVQLYRSTTKVGKEVTTSSGSHDFSSAISGKGTGKYFFTVMPVKGGEEYMVVSDVLEVDSETMSEIRSYLKEKKAEAKASNVPTGGPRWVMNPNGTYKFLKEDGTYIKNDWLQENGLWYYLGSDSLMVTGWQKIRNYWYYFDKEKGFLLVNTQTPDGYTVNGDGVWIDPATGQPYNAAAASGSGSSAGGQVQTAPYLTDLTTVKLNLREGSAEAGQIRKVDVSAPSNVIVNEVTYSIPYEQWGIGTSVTINVSVSAATNYKFTTTTKYSLGSAEFLGSEGDEFNRTLHFSYSPRMTLQTPDGLYITSDGILKWNKVPHAAQYKVALSYTNEEDNKSSKTLTVTKPEADLSEYIGFYTDMSARITAQGSKSSKSSKSKTSSLQDSSAAVIEDMDAFVENNTLDGKFRTSGDSLSYRDDSGEKLTGWQQLAGAWYLFDSDGNAAGPGWATDPDSGLWYYFDSDHRMVTGKINDNGTEYFLNDGSHPELPVGAWVE